MGVWGGVGWAMDLPAVPVLAEPLQASDVEPGNTTHTRSGEARESTTRSTTGGADVIGTDSRGGGQAPLTNADLLAAYEKLRESGPRDLPSFHPCLSLEDLDRWYEKETGHAHDSWPNKNYFKVESRHEGYYPLNLWDETLP